MRRAIRRPLRGIRAPSGASGLPSMFPAIAGQPVIGETVTALILGAPASGTISWALDGVTINGETSNTLVVPNAAGADLTVTVNGFASAPVQIAEIDVTVSIGSGAVTTATTLSASVTGIQSGQFIEWGFQDDGVDIANSEGSGAWPQTIEYWVAIGLLSEGSAVRAWLSVDGGDRVFSQARTLVYSAPTAAGALADQSFVQGSGDQTLDASGDFTFAGTGVYSITPSIGDVDIDETTGLITFDTNQIGPQTDTTVTVRLSDANVITRFAESSFSLDITLGQSPSNPVLVAGGPENYSPPADGEPQAVDVPGNYTGPDSLTKYGVLGIEPIIVTRAELRAQAGGTNTREFFTIPNFSFEDGSFDLSGLSDEESNAIVFFVAEDNNGGESALATWVTGISGLDFTPPAFSSAEVGNVANTTVRVTATEALYGTTTAADWALAGATITAASLTPGNEYVDLTLSAAASNTDDFTGDLDFTGADITDIAGITFPTFADQDVTNNVSPPASANAAASDLWEPGEITSTEVSQSMAIGTADPDREVLFLVGMEGGSGKAPGFDFTFDGTSYEGGVSELASRFENNACVIGFNVPAPTGAAATVGLTHGTSGSSVANTLIAIPHTGAVVDSLTDYGIGTTLTGSINAVAGGTLHILLFGRDETFDNGTITINDPAGATLETTIVAPNDIQNGAHPINSNSGRAYLKLENTPAGPLSISIDTTAAAPSRWAMLAVALDT